MIENEDRPSPATLLDLDKSGHCGNIRGFPEITSGRRIDGIENAIDPAGIVQVNRKKSLMGRVQLRITFAIKTKSG
jgi:hypothetical protein